MGEEYPVDVKRLIKFYQILIGNREFLRGLLKTFVPKEEVEEEIEAQEGWIKSIEEKIVYVDKDLYEGLIYRLELKIEKPEKKEMTFSERIGILFKKYNLF